MFGKVGNKFEHQYRSKISLRIEWEHSKLLKATLKYRKSDKPKKILFQKTCQHVGRPPLKTVFWFPALRNPDECGIDSTSFGHNKHASGILPKR